jgi:HTH-type transcriptional repressor of NAD biosynthesis genes
VYKTGVFAGKFLPPHRGHLSQIINSATQCETLYVVVSDNKKVTAKLCEDAKLPLMSANLRVKWLSQELQGFEHIKIVLLDESDIPEYPYGWGYWANYLKSVFDKKIDVFFSGDSEYEVGYKSYFPDADFKLFDYKRERYPISATLIREQPFKYWDYILGSARPFFAKKFLITGTESCGKTTTTKYLAKIFYTSWSEEAGRYYAGKFLGGNEAIYTEEDFGRIAYLQYESDMDALQKANKVVFYDTDAVVTQYYAELYLGKKVNMVENFIDPTRYDIVMMFAPTVPWVDDGMRFNGDQNRRETLNKKLLNMYENYGFKNIRIFYGNYHQRLEACITLTNELLKGELYA